MPTRTTSGEQVVHLEEALVEEHEPLLGIDHAQAVRHALERRLVQRKQFLELTRADQPERRLHAFMEAVASPTPWEANTEGGYNRRLIVLV